MYLKALDNGSESEKCTVAVGNSSPFGNLEARTSNLDIRNVLVTTDPGSDQLDNDAKVLGAAVWVRPSLRWATHTAPFVSPIKPNPKSQQINNEMPQFISHASIQTVAIFSIHVVLLTPIHFPTRSPIKPSLTLLRLVLFQHLLHNLLLLNQKCPCYSILHAVGTS